MTPAKSLLVTLLFFSFGNNNNLSQIHNSEAWVCDDHPILVVLLHSKKGN